MVNPQKSRLPIRAHGARQCATNRDHQSPQPGGRHGRPTRVARASPIRAAGGWSETSVAATVIAAVVTANALATALCLTGAATAFSLSSRRLGSEGFGVI